MKNESTKDSTDTYVKMILKLEIKNELNKHEIIGLNSFANRGYYYTDKNNNLVKIWAIDGSPYGVSHFRFYLKKSKLVFTDIEFGDLKEEYWNKMDPVVFNDKNTDYTYEQTYFINDSTHLTIENHGYLTKIQDNRLKVILNQFNELLTLINNQK